MLVCVKGRKGVLVCVNFGQDALIVNIRVLRMGTDWCACNWVC